MNRILKLCLLFLFIFKPTFSTSLPKDIIDKWKIQIDNTWPDNLSTQQKLELFDQIWKSVDEKFAEFPDLNLNWNNVKEKYRPEIEQGVSRGRFVGMMNHLTLLLQESHTFFCDSLVNLGTLPKPGVPLSYVGGWGNNSHFGAGLTPLTDSTMLVYQVVPNHPLNLETGDIVLGYDGIRWRKLYKELINLELPVGKFSNGLYEWGTNNDAFVHSWLMSAGLNWHLFEKIDIVKHDSGDTLQLPTHLLQDKEMNIYCTEQMSVPGVPFPEIQNDEYLSWGIIEGTKIGYINVWKWLNTETYNVSDHFLLAMEQLTGKQDLNGIIIDQRYNTGGFSAYTTGLGTIFRNPAVFVAFFSSNDPANHYSFIGRICTGGVGWNDLVPIYNKPIAVLTGAGAISAADFFVRILKFYPKSRTFGKSTSSAFGSPVWINTGINGWFCKYSILNFAFVDSSLFDKEIDPILDNVQLLAKTILNVDEEVWLTPEDVRKGKDTVIEAAISWIQSQATYVSHDKANLNNFNLIVSEFQSFGKNKKINRRFHR